MTQPHTEYELQAWATIRHHLAPILPWVENELCTEVMANPDGTVWVDTNDRGMFMTDIIMSQTARLAVLEAVASSMDKTITVENPEIGGIIPVLGARFHGLAAPATLRASFALRLPPRKLYHIRDYLDAGTLTQPQAKVLAQAVAGRQNILVVGGTGSGKTTFCNALLDMLGLTNHRVLLIEDARELQCVAPNKIGIQVNEEVGFGYRRAVKAAMRLRPDRIVVGELRSGHATLEMLKAWNTDHNGGMSTIHANSAKMSLPRVEQLLREVSPHVDKTLIAQAINVLVYMERYEDADGRSKRRVLDVATVSPGLSQTGEYVLEHTWHPSHS